MRRDKYRDMSALLPLPEGVAALSPASPRCAWMPLRPPRRDVVETWG